MVRWAKTPPVEPASHVGTSLSPSNSTSSPVSCLGPEKIVDVPQSLAPRPTWEIWKNLLAGLALAIVATEAVNQQMKRLPSSPHVCNSAFQINTSLKGEKLPVRLPARVFPT